MWYLVSMELSLLMRKQVLEPTLHRSLWAFKKAKKYLCTSSPCSQPGVIQKDYICLCIWISKNWTLEEERGDKGEVFLYQETSEASFSTVSTVGSKSRALLSRPKSSAMRSAPYRSPYLLITYMVERKESRESENEAGDKVECLLSQWFLKVRAWTRFPF